MICVHAHMDTDRHTDRYNHTNMIEIQISSVECLPCIHIQCTKNDNNATTQTHAHTTVCTRRDSKGEMGWAEGGVVNGVNRCTKCKPV